MKKAMTKILVLAAISSVMALSGCRLGDDTKQINNDFLGAQDENTTALCSDGRDNDGDTVADCDDPGCLNTVNVDSPGNTVCPNVDGVLKENNDYTCSDGIDNDGNGYVDCTDNNCKKTSYCCPSPGEETSLEACSDGIDNDCDGYTDCSSYTCSRSSDAQVKQYCQNENCPDGVSDETSVEACSDGLDNDCDGYKDCESYTCTRADRGASPEAIEWCNRDKTPKPEDTEAACSDNVDNDLDGLTDCADADCKSFAYCQNLIKEIDVRPTNFDSMSPDERAAILDREKLICTDGFDNDHNGLTDCNDYQCMIRSLETLTGTEAQYMFNCPSENKPDLCTDLVDDDHNGKIDCLDPNCKLYPVCQNLPREIETRSSAFSQLFNYTSGADNEANSAVDAQNETAKKNRYNILLNEKTLCTDGQDNNHNGLVDCAEPSCRTRSLETINDWKNMNLAKIVTKGANNEETVVGEKQLLTDEEITQWTNTLVFTCPTENSEAQCSNSRDDDYDGLADCADPKCAGFTYCSNTVPEFSPRPDNFDQLSAAERATILRNELTLCTDGIDNDKDGKKDCEVEECVRRSYEILTGDEAQFMFNYKIPSLDGTTYEFGCK